MLLRKKKSATKRAQREEKNRRMRTRAVHVIDDNTSDRDLALAKSDLLNFFADSLDKHHPGW